MLITRAEIYGDAQRTLQDVRITGDRIGAIGAIEPQSGETVIDAAGSALLPGLHDHHFHLLSYAASLASVRCGPPSVHDESALINALRSQQGDGWLRGYGYHESVAGNIDRRWLDAHLPDRPARIQHRSGRLWSLNSAALTELSTRQGEGDRALPEDGRLYDADARLGTLLGRQLPPVEDASRKLAASGITGITDMTPSNNAETLTLFSELQAADSLLQKVHLAGSPALPFPMAAEGICTGPTKIHLHDSALPEFESLCAIISNSHTNARPIAVHCVTEVELVFTLAAIEAAGTLPGDRIEHASVTPPHLLDMLQTLDLTVVTQPNFIIERGDAYLNDLPEQEHDWLYRARGFLDHGIPLAGGTDAPFGEADPWLAIRSAVERRSGSGRLMGANEALTPEQAVALFLGHPSEAATPRQIEIGSPADLCLLDRPWRQARALLSQEMVKATFCSGVRIY